MSALPAEVSVTHSPGNRRFNSVMIFWLVLFGMTAIRAVFNATMPLSGEEAYYWMWSLRPDWSYFDHPPLTAWLIHMVTGIAGHSVFAIRLTALASHVIAAIAIFNCVRRLTGDATRAAWAGLIFTSLAYFAAMSTLILPDSVLFACWAFALWMLIEATVLRHRWAWPLAGIALGLCALTKFHAILLGIALIIFLSVSAQRRHYFRDPLMYIAGAIAITMTLPIFFWNVREGWPTFGFQFAQRQRMIFPSPIYFIEMLATPFVYVGPLLFPLCVAAAIWGIRQWKRERREEFLLLSLACAVPFVFFLVLSLFLRIDPQWAAPGFIAGTILMAMFGVDLLQKNSTKLRRALPVSVYLNLFLLLVAHGFFFAVMAHPCLADFQLRVIPHRSKSDMARLGRFFGWNEIGLRVRDEITLLGGADKAFIYSPDGFGTLSNLRYYSGLDVPAFMWRPPYRGLQYHIWERRMDPAGLNAIIISRKEKYVDPALHRQFFSRVESAPDIVIMRDEKEQQRYHVLRAWGVRIRPDSDARPALK